MIGDFNCYIGKSGGPWSLDAVKERGCDLPKMIERQCLISVNSQDLCSGCTGTYFAEGGSVQTTTVHILMRKDSVHFVKSCFVSDDHSHIYLTNYLLFAVVIYRLVQRKHHRIVIREVQLIGNLSTT